MGNSSNPADFQIRPATVVDIPAILRLIKELAEYERLSHEVVATEQLLRETLFVDKPSAEVVIGEFEGQPVGFALFFHNYSTFLGRPGIYLEDVYVQPDYRGRGFGAAFLRYLARLTVERDCGRLEWSVLDWNEPALSFYRKLGAVPMDEWTTHRVTGEALQNLASGSRTS